MDFILWMKKKNVHPKTFVETIKIFKAKKDEKAIQLHKNHHLQVDIALKEFEKEQYEKISENQGVNTTLGPQSKQALAFLDLCSRADFLNLVEKEKILMAKKCIRDSRFIELQREINRHKNLSKKTKLKITQTIDGLLRILKKFPLEDVNNTQKINDETIPEIIISESYN